MQIITLVVVFVCVIVAASILSKSSFSVRTTETSVTKDGTLTNTISVSGDGTAVTEPDLITISFTAEQTSLTTKDAMQKVNTQIKQVMDIAKKYGVKEQKIKTTNLSLYPDYEWTNITRVFKGYKATQTVMIESAYDKNNSSAVNILDEATSINGLQVGNINFDFENKTALANQARELAYKSAFEKAKQLADLSGVRLGKPVSIVDQSEQYNRTNEYEMNYAADMLSRGKTASAPATQISGGELEHRITLQVIFGIE